ncbi:TPA: phage portal protein [Citrobacter freundii]
MEEPKYTIDLRTNNGWWARLQSWFVGGRLVTPNQGSQTGPVSAHGHLGDSSINDERILQISTVWRCVSLISTLTACLPLDVFETDQNDNRKKVDLSNPLARLLRYSPNQYMTAQEFREAMTMQLCFYGNVPRSSTTSFDVSGIYAGRYLVRVRAINAAEISSGWGYSEEKTLTGKVGNPPKPVGFATTPINWGIRLNWGFPANTGDTLKTEIQYTANSDFSNPLLLSDVPYPSAEYTQLGLKAGQEFWYRAQLVDRTGNESGWTDWVRGESNANADDYLGDIADDFLTSADGDRLTSDIDTNLEAALQNALANHGTVEHQWAQYGEVRADILVVKTTIAQVDKAMAEMSTQVQAQFNDVTAALEDKLTAVVDATGASAIYTLKTGVRINGVMYNAGMSIAVLAEAGKPVVTRVGFNANQFVLMSGSGDMQYSPFAVINGQVFISDAFIQYGQITLAKIGELRSANYVQGQTGTIMKSDGTFEMNGAVAGEGATKMTNLNYSVKDGNGVLRVQIGKLTGVF